MASLKLVVLVVAAIVAVTQASPIMPQASAVKESSMAEEDAARPKRERIPVRLAEARDDSYGQPAYAPAPAYKPAPSYHKGGPVYVKTFVKTDYDGNFKWGVKHNI